MIVDSMIQSKTIFCKKCAACYKDIQLIVCECNDRKVMKQVEKFPLVWPEEFDLHSHLSLHVSPNL